MLHVNDSLFAKTFAMKVFLLKIRDWFTTHIIMFLAFIMCIPILAYICNFGCNGISEDVSDWANFGDYIGGVYSVLVTVLAIYLAQELNHRDKLKESRRYAISQIHAQFLKMKHCPVSTMAKSVNKFFKLIEENRFYLSDEQLQKLQAFGNYYLEHTNSNNRDANAENEMLAYILRMHNV